MANTADRDLRFLNDGETLRLSSALPPVQNVINVLKLGIRAIDANPLKAYILFKKMAKVMVDISDLLREQANAIYESEHPDRDVFEYEGCTIKGYTEPKKYTFTKKVTALEAEVATLNGRIKAMKSLEIAEGRAKLIPVDPDKIQTKFTVTVG